VSESNPDERLYWFRTMPGDPDHLPSYYFSSGVVRATPAEMDTLVAAVYKEHPILLFVDPVEERTSTFDEFRSTLGSALHSYHEIERSETCDMDAPFIAEWEEHG
jgi:hypothetical protein